MMMMKDLSSVWRSRSVKDTTTGSLSSSFLRSSYLSKTPLREPNRRAEIVQFLSNPAAQKKYPPRPFARAKFTLLLIDSVSSYLIQFVPAYEYVDKVVFSRDC
ncbi:hypothetical protein CsSME_00007961 [Camellia sinensis var. sinensis]